MCLKWNSDFVYPLIPKHLKIESSMKPLICVMFFLGCPLSAYAAIYEWIDAVGVRHFSDEAVSQASELFLQSPQVYTSKKSEALLPIEIEQGRQLPPPADLHVLQKNSSTTSRKTITPGILP